ncbi:hypothetical protein GPECTOR_134g620 [Gonium pectorale]|uniref:Uncharacterized protein n=1 Tax=Gonium pectorale TaxID=33097 RepID=A0A150FY84_GONPE|nr:hypothetical protein GPECTOR_134g620 [Gonium pectorale]|eukprot:KXZ42566.1 hypothetical protein GPECTOR_134g620 [Gonium pectorale]
MACSPVKSRTIVLLEFLSLGVLSLTITLSLYFVIGDELDTTSSMLCQPGGQHAEVTALTQSVAADSSDTLPRRNSCEVL